MDTLTGLIDPETLQAAWEKAAEEIGRINVAVFGKTGVGKSTLINVFFGEEVATTGIGEPVTKERYLHLHRSGRLGILDGPGVEIGVNANGILKDLESYISVIRSKPVNEQIHVAWYCVRAMDRRFEPVEADFVRQLHSLGLPVIVVLTQAPVKDEVTHPDALELATQISELKLPIYCPPVLVMAKLDEFAGYPAHGLAELFAQTERAVPEGVRQALIAEQRVDFEAKRKEAQHIITLATTAAGAAGAFPLPFADAIPITGAQIAMMMKIAQIYNLPFDKAGIAAIAGPVAALSGGKAAVGGLIKLIPGAGWVIGGAINASVAGSFTVAMGYAWIAICGKLTEGKLTLVNGLPDNALIKDVFLTELKSRLKLNRKNNSTKN